MRVAGSSDGRRRQWQHPAAIAAATDGDQLPCAHEECLHNAAPMVTSCVTLADTL